MQSFVAHVNGHKIEIAVSRWNGKERVSYDGEVVSEKRNVNTFVTTHIFEREEEGAAVAYEVNLITGFLGAGYTLRRNGIAVACAP